MKKLVSLICVLSLILGCVPAGVSFADELNISVNEAFDNIATNGAPENIVVRTGLDARVVERDGTNKALYAKADGNAVKISVPVAKAYSKTVFNFDIKIDGSPVKGEALTLTGSKTAKLFNFSHDRKIRLDDGMDVGGYASGRWTSYALVVNFDTNLYDLYIDGKCKFTKRYFYSNPSKPTSLDFNLSCVNDGDVAEVYLDNLMVYEGNKPLALSKLPSKGKNTEVLPFDPTAKTEKVYDTVFVDSNSKQGIGSFSLVAKTGTVANWQAMEEGGTPYIHFVKTSESDTYGDLTIKAYDGLDKYIYQADIYVVANQASIIFARANNDKASPSYSNLLYVSGSNGKLVAGSETVGSIEFGKWVNIALAVDLLKETQSIYVDGKLIAENVPLHNGGVVPKYFRVGFTSGSSTNSEYYLNKIKVYDGNTLRTFDDELSADVGDEDFFMAESMKKTRNETASQAQELLGTDVVLMTRNGKFYAGGKKLDYSDFGKDSYIENGVLYADVKVLEYALETELPIDNGFINAKGTKLETVQKDGAYFADASKVGKAFNKVIYDEITDRNFIIFSDSPKGYSNNMFSQENEEDIDVLWRYMQFDRPSPDEIFETFKSGDTYKSHPRLLIKKDEIPSLRQRVNSNPELKSILNSIITTCDGYIGKAPVARQLQADGFRLFSACAGVKNRLLDLCTVYLITGDEKYAERAWVEMENALNWEDWNLTVHFLDSGEIGPGMAYAYDILYDYLTPEQREFAKEKIQEKYLDFCVGVYTGNSNYDPLAYKNTTSNWGAVCGASMMMVAFAFMDEESPDSLLTKKCSYVISNALQTFEHIITAAAPEGHWYEGIGYYEYVQQHLGWCLEVLDNTTGKHYNILSANGISDITEYIMYMSTKNGGYNKSATTGVISAFAPEAFIYAKLNNRPDLMGLYADYRKSVAITSFLSQYLLFYDTDYADHSYKTSLPLDRYYVSNGVGVMRGSWTDAESLYVGMSGGYTSQFGDTHYDKGSFIFESQGIRWSIDMGRNGNNTMPYLERAETHSALVINPTADNVGQAFETYSKVIKSESKARGAYMVYDFTDIYGEWVNDYKRGFMVSDDRSSLTVRDELSLKAQSDLKWNMITKAQIEISADGKSAILTQNGKKLKVTAYCSASDWRLEIDDLEPTGGWQEVSFATVDEQKKFASGVRKLVLSAKASGKVDIAVKLSPVIDGENYAPVENIAFSSWTIPDGEIPPKPQADAIYMDGKPMQGFLPGIKQYTVSCNYGTPIPQFAASASLGTVEVKQASSFADYTVIKITLDDGRYTTYRIGFNVSERVTDSIIDTAPEKSLPGNMKLLDIVGVRSDHEPQPQNAAVNVADGDLNTRWSSDQKGAYVEVDLGKSYDLKGIALAFADGDTRNYKYDILISEDKMDYKRIYSGFSLGGTLDYEYLPTDVKARYVRYVGFQHKTGSWNSIAEVRPVISQ